MDEGHFKTRLRPQHPQVGDARVCRFPFVVAARTRKFSPGRPSLEDHARKENWSDRDLPWRPLGASSRVPSLVPVAQDFEPPSLRIASCFEESLDQLGQKGGWLARLVSACKTGRLGVPEDGKADGWEAKPPNEPEKRDRVVSLTGRERSGAGGLWHKAGFERVQSERRTAPCQCPHGSARAAQISVMLLSITSWRAMELNAEGWSAGDKK